MRIRYRASQFLKALTTRPTASQLDQARKLLNPELMALFTQLQPAEQSHSLAIYEQLVANGEHNPDLLSAALLHDIGKTRAPLRIWERVIIVLAKSLFPNQVAEWGKGQPAGWKHAFVVAENHAEWGAEMAAAAGATPTTVDIIRRHHQQIGLFSAPKTNQSTEEVLLLKLQSVDEES